MVDPCASYISSNWDIRGSHSADSYRMVKLDQSEAFTKSTSICAIDGGFGYKFMIGIFDSGSQRVSMYGISFVSQISAAWIDDVFSSGPKIAETPFCKRNPLAFEHIVTSVVESSPLAIRRLPSRSHIHCHTKPLQFHFSIWNPRRWARSCLHDRSRTQSLACFHLYSHQIRHLENNQLECIYLIIPPQ